MIGDPRSTVDKKFLSWHTLIQERNQLEKNILNQENRLNILRSSLKPETLDYLEQKSGNADGISVSNRSRDSFTRTLEKIIEAEADIAALRIKWIELCSEIDSIEMSISILSVRQQNILRSYYRDRCQGRNLFDPRTRQSLYKIFG